MTQNARICFASPARVSGFTVIELLLGMLIFAIIAAGLSGTLHSGLEINRRVERAEGVEHDLIWAVAQIRRDLENAVYYDFSGSYPDRAAFSGQADRLTCLIIAPDGLKAVSYYLSDPYPGPGNSTAIRENESTAEASGRERSRNEKVRLLIRQEQLWQDFLSSAGQNDPEIEVLSYGVPERGLRFQYAADEKSSPAEPIEWKDQWTAAGLPALVKVQLTLVNVVYHQQRISTSQVIMIPIGRHAGPH